MTNTAIDHSELVEEYKKLEQFVQSKQSNDELMQLHNALLRASRKAEITPKAEIKEYDSGCLSEEVLYQSDRKYDPKNIQADADFVMEMFRKREQSYDKPHVLRELLKMKVYKDKKPGTIDRLFNIKKNKSNKAN